MAKLTLTDITSGYQSFSTYNANNALIEAALENTLSRNGEAPNAMGANLDMNSNRITNLPTAVNSSEPVTLGQAASIAGVTSPLTQAGVGAVLYPQSSGEGSLSITPTNYYYPPGDIRRYGADTSTSDNTTAIQNAINVAATDGHKVFIPGTNGKRYQFASTVYGYYDATNNPQFPSGVRQDGRLFIEGEGAPNKDNFSNNEYRGSVLEYTGATGVGLDFYDDSGTEAKAVVLKDFGLYANTTGYPLQLDRVPQITLVDNVFVGNDGNGGGIKIDTWASQLQNVWVYGNGSGSGIAFDTSDGGGNVVWTNVNAENFAVGMDFGSAYTGTRTIEYIWNHILHGCQTKGCTVGLRIREGVGSMTILDHWSETNTSRGIEINNGAAIGDSDSNFGLIKIIGGFFADTAGANFIHIEIGDDTATDNTDKVGPVWIQGAIMAQTAALSDAIRIHNSASNGFRKIENVVFHNNTGQYIVIDAEAQYGPLSVINCDTDGVNERNTIEDTSGNDASMWAYETTKITPTTVAGTNYDLSNASVIPKNFNVTTAGGACIITLPDNPVENTYFMTKSNGASTLTLKSSAYSGANDYINGAGADWTTNETYKQYILSWNRGYGWTIQACIPPGTSAWTVGAHTTLRDFTGTTTAAQALQLLETLVEELQTAGILA